MRAAFLLCYLAAGLASASPLILPLPLFGGPPVATPSAEVPAAAASPVVPSPVASSVPPLLAAGSAMPSDLAARALALHNRERMRLGEHALVWDEALAQDALVWARQLARSGQLAHTPTELRKGQGENLFMGTTGAYTIEAMFEDFIAERDDFRPGTFPAIARDGNWQNVGHYAQIVWPATQRLGCAIAQGAQNDVLVCRYWPAGNIYGQAVP